MKIKVLFLVFLLTCSAGISYAAVNGSIDVSMHDAGGPGQGGTIFPLAARALSVTSPAVAATLKVTVTDNKAVNVLFKSNVGVATIVIKDEAGAVYYSKRVNTAKSAQVSANIRMLPEGTYTISVTSADGTLKKEGTFYVD